MRDGVQLSGNLYLPQRIDGPVPAIVTLTPYIAQIFHDDGVFYAQNGYAFLAVDVRGRGNSDGRFEPLKNEAQDGHDVVEWVAQQSFCDGQVAMFGGSYGGFAQWATAATLPPHLKTIVPVAAAYIGHDIPMRSNMTWPYMMQWLTLVSGRTLQDKMFFGDQTFWGRQFQAWHESGLSYRELDSYVGNPSDTFQEWNAHPNVDDYWDRYNPRPEQIAQLDMPVLTITGAYDADQPGALRHYREHVGSRDRRNAQDHYLVIGPWDHAGTRKPQQNFGGLAFGIKSVIDMGRLHLDWYDWIMRAGSRPRFLADKVAYYTMGHEDWHFSPTLEKVTTDRICLYLASDGHASEDLTAGLLQPSAKSTAADSYSYDPRDISGAKNEAESEAPLSTRPLFPVDDLADLAHQIKQPGKQLVYHSGAFDRDVEVSGFFQFVGWLGIDQPDTDFRICIYEIDKTGKSTLLSVDTMRARYRESVRFESLVKDDKPLRYDFSSFTFVSRLVEAGSRLRLIVGPINSIFNQKNYNSGRAVAEETMADARIVRVTLFHEVDFPSALYVPVGGADCQVSASDAAVIL